jgi:HEAT repeat protein
LRSDAPAIRNVALLTIRQNPSEAFATALNAEIDRAPRDLQIRLIDALTDCHNSESVSILWSKVASDDAVVRLATLRVLQAIGGPDNAPALIKVLQENRDKETLSMAVSILERLEGGQVDAQILKALSSAKESHVRIALIGLLGKRSVTGAADELLRQAADPDTRVSLAAFWALKSVARMDALPRLIELTQACRDDSVRDAAVLAVYSVCRSHEDRDQSAELILRELRTTIVAAEKMAWIRVLTMLGYADALPTITAALQDANQVLVQSTISQLSRWPDPSPIDDLFEVVESDTTANVRRRALLAVLQLATAAADRKQASDEDLVSWFKRAGKAAQSTQAKRLLISGLGRIEHVESVRLLASYLDDADVKMEAVNAILNAAGPLAKGPDYATVGLVLNRMSDVKDPRLLNQMATLRRDVKTTAAKLKQ